MTNFINFPTIIFVFSIFRLIGLSQKQLYYAVFINCWFSLLWVLLSRRKYVINFWFINIHLLIITSELYFGSVWWHYYLHLWHSMVFVAQQGKKEVSVFANECTASLINLHCWFVKIECWNLCWGMFFNWI
jgi:hypothetical protein